MTSNSVDTVVQLIKQAESTTVYQHTPNFTIIVHGAYEYDSTKELVVHEFSGFVTRELAEQAASRIVTSLNSRSTYEFVHLIVEKS